MKIVAALMLLTLAGCEEKKAAPPSPPLTTMPATAAVATPTDPAPIPVGTKMKCPVTGEDFTVKENTKQVVYNGKRYAFCCADCEPDFKKDPAKYAKN
jgi:YHS domain-containing protein